MCPAPVTVCSCCTRDPTHCNFPLNATCLCYTTARSYTNICRSLFEKDKLLFAFLLAARIMMGRKELDPHLYQFLLTGAPCFGCVAGAWHLVRLLSCDMPTTSCCLMAMPLYGFCLSLLSAWKNHQLPSHVILCVRTPIPSSWPGLLSFPATHKPTSFEPSAQAVWVWRSRRPWPSRLVRGASG